MSRPNFLTRETLAAWAEADSQSYPVFVSGLERFRQRAGKTARVCTDAATTGAHFRAAAFVSVLAHRRGVSRGPRWTAFCIELDAFGLESAVTLGYRHLDRDRGEHGVEVFTPKLRYSIVHGIFEHVRRQRVLQPVAKRT